MLRRDGHLEKGGKGSFNVTSAHSSTPQHQKLKKKGVPKRLPVSRSHEVHSEHFLENITEHNTPSYRRC
ncbi:hypothetical protein LWI29_018046 [Acer saccharum]|uniref:Uncharacterized protein n=1 Tax=Acer saccharum TaxID=4024 RepID=A0AA39VBX1_ACESA|nr:hypothetical protein LWI29_018046 [Acer saccharum]